MANTLPNSGSHKSPSVELSVSDLGVANSLDVQVLKMASYSPIDSTFTTSSLPGTFALKVQILDSTVGEKLYLSVTPEFESLGLKLYSSEFIATEFAGDLSRGITIPFGENYIELKPKSGVIKPTLFLQFSKGFSPLLTIKILNEHELAKEKLDHKFNAGLYIGVALCMLLLIAFFYFQYRKTCLITLWLATLFIVISSILRDHIFTGDIMSFIQERDRAMLYGSISYIYRCMLSLFLANFIFNFSKNIYLKFFSAFNFIGSVLIVFGLISSKSDDLVLYSGVNFIANLLLIMSCLILELRKESNSRWLYLFVWPAIFIAVYYLALFLNLAPIPQDINYHDLEWYRIYYTAIFIFILYILYNSEAYAKALKMKESEILLLAKLDQERALRADQEELNRVLSHELKTPLTALYFLIDRLAAALKPQGETIEAILFKIKSSAQQINAVTDRFAWLGKSNFPDDLHTVQNINILEVVKGVLEVTDQESRFHITNDEIIYIESDLFCLTTVIQNLIDNALKYSRPESVINLNIFQYDETHIKLNIANSMLSQHHIDLDRIFDKYYRGIGSGGKPGLGLGLWLAKDIAQKIGGNINAFYDGEQIVFGFTIPIRQIQNA